MIKTLEKIIEAHFRLRTIPKKEQLLRLCEILEINREMVRLGRDLSKDVPYVFVSNRYEDAFLIFRAPDSTITVQIANLITSKNADSNQSVHSRRPALDFRSELPTQASAWSFTPALSRIVFTALFRNTSLPGCSQMDL